MNDDDPDAEDRVAEVGVETPTLDEAERKQSPNVGKLRPSQVVTQHGPGAIVDLPELSVVIAGINHWFKAPADRVLEPRLEAYLGVSGLYRPPQWTKGRRGGVPAFVFPEYLVCPVEKCRRLALYDEFVWRSGEFRCNAPIHAGRERKPSVFPARFLIACAHGHLDDFPWRPWLHGAETCSGEMKLRDLGTSGAASDLQVECEACKKKRRLGDAFDVDAHPACSARRPWLSPQDHDPKGCDQTPRTILRGASNAYFSVVASALSIPPWSDPVHMALAPYIDMLTKVDTLEKLEQLVPLVDFGDLLERFTIDDVWKALNAKADPDEADLKLREYAAFRNPEVKVEEGAEFEVHRRAVPTDLEGHLGDVVAVSRLREVRALRAFNRIDSVPDFGERSDVTEIENRMAPIGLAEDTWRPAVDLRGEGIFLHLDGLELTAWERRPKVLTRSADLEQQFRESWKFATAAPFPGMRFVLLHTLAHGLIRQMSFDCGYSSSALRERIYCGRDQSEMCGILIYTATSDSDGSLGGLVDLARPERLGPIIHETLHDARYCASDPLCASGEAGAHAQVNGAACHACLLIAETSCEVGNRMLDRAVLADTVSARGISFFG